MCSSTCRSSIPSTTGHWAGPHLTTFAISCASLDSSSAHQWSQELEQIEVLSGVATSQQSYHSNSNAANLFKVSCRVVLQGIIHFKNLAWQVSFHHIQCRSFDNEVESVQWFVCRPAPCGPLLTSSGSSAPGSSRSCAGLHRKHLRTASPSTTVLCNSPTGRQVVLHIANWPFDNLTFLEGHDIHFRQAYGSKLFSLFSRCWDCVFFAGSIWLAVLEWANCYQHGSNASRMQSTFARHSRIGPVPRRCLPFLLHLSAELWSQVDCAEPLCPCSCSQGRNLPSVTPRKRTSRSATQIAKLTICRTLHAARDVWTSAKLPLALESVACRCATTNGSFFCLVCRYGIDASTSRKRKELLDLFRYQTLWMQSVDWVFPT